MADDLAAAVRAYEVARSAVTDAQEEEAARIVAAAKPGVVAARKRLPDAIVAAARNGSRQVDIVPATGYTRERVRQILRANGVEAD
ncbi:hypothetical protein PSN13_01359 [Micromonospora saelicesensis]|uniref:Uncharacterized protein n=1 Tax=Micromonospora saelicesensis TaxID=285676 RepID=A0A328NV96_9ACTN|nr:hypothetical protein [Micromonospora saelicesensis]RAO37377.1 hypothetical protein PSN13_01359 [Micromonospora saelicesensis]